ncbi:hypothetical protein CWN31_16275 [Klebsiella pneumoniae]|nr:SIR2 family protein [Klebsiella pneumoniae]PLL17342.1 hypothetical protein CWN31_16275 [Klebsiella pneumoniae]
MSVVETYQKSFAYLLKVGDQEMVREVLAIIMGKAQPAENEWYISKCIDDLTRLICETNIDVGIILTTNFDEVIEYSLYRAGREPIIKDLTIDQPIGGTQGYTEKEIVVHLHGLWNRDTMHSTHQLSALRPKIESSIRNVLSDSKLYVLGYAGWDDIFLQALASIVNDDNATYNIRWAFYESVPEKALADNQSLFSLVSDATANGRFQGYCGVDCHKLFEDVLNAQKKKITAPHTGFRPNSRSVVPTQKMPRLTRHILSHEPAHEVVRISEQLFAIQALQSTGSLELLCGWGYGKSGFLYSFLNDEFSEYNVLYSDLTGLITPEEIAKKITLDIGTDITWIFSNSEAGKFIVVLDNISNITHPATNYLHELSRLCSDYNSNVKIIFIGTHPINLQIEQLSLNPLSVDEVKEYLRGESKLAGITREQLDKTLENTSGLPSKLDKFKEYLRLMSLAEVLDDGVITLPEEEFSAEIPTYLINRIENLKIDHKKIFSLLEVFSVLDCGERLKNIRERFSENRYVYNDFSKLERDGLIYSLQIENETILRINPLIRDYVSTSLSTDNYTQLVTKCLSICIGTDWMAGHIKIAPVTQFMLQHTEFYPGNVHTLIRNYFELTEFDPQSRGTKAIIMASIGYCMYLNHNDYYKELVSFSRMVFNKISCYECMEKYHLAWYLATGLRMIDEDDESAEFLEAILTNYEKSEFYSKRMAIKMMGTIMRSLTESDRDRTLQYARKIKSIADKNSGIYLSAEAEIYEDLSKSLKIDKLKKLERKARKHKETSTANNISLRLYALLSNNKDQYVDNVINHSETGLYTRVRALISKYESVLEAEEYFRFTPEVIAELKRAYHYLFCQRLDGLFNRCSELLWRIAVDNSDLEYLYRLFKSSSIIWRVNSMPEKELIFASELVSITTPTKLANGEVEYLQIRIRVLRNSYEPENDDSIVCEQ